MDTYGRAESSVSFLVCIRSGPSLEVFSRNRHPIDLSPRFHWPISLSSVRGAVDLAALALIRSSHSALLDHWLHTNESLKSPLARSPLPRSLLSSALLFKVVQL